MTATKANRSGSDNSTSHREEEEAPNLDAEETTVLQGAQRSEITAQEQLAYRTRLPEMHVNDPLRSLSSHDLVDVQPTFTAVQVRARQRGGADA